MNMCCGELRETSVDYILSWLSNEKKTKKNQKKIKNKTTNNTKFWWSATRAQAWKHDAVSTGLSRG